MKEESLLTKDELVSGTSGFALENGADCYFTNVVTDSRNVCKNSMFVPLVGEFQNGHKYIPQALEAGASVVLLNKAELSEKGSLYEKIASENPSALFIAVENTLHGLQDAAEKYVEKFTDLTKVSITGSSGKTTTKEMMVSVVKQHYGEDFVVHTQGNLNSETGLPLSVFNIRKAHKIGVFEMGMNRENEIGEISKVLKSQYGIITNIGTAHIGILGSKENIAREKRKSLDYIPSNGAAFVPANDEFADFCTENVKGKIVKFGADNTDKGRWSIQLIKDDGLFGINFKINGVNVKLPLSGQHNYYDALAVVECAEELGISEEEIKAGLESMKSVSGRMETTSFQAHNGAEITVIKDCYNANPDSMDKLLTFVDKLDNGGRKLLVLGDMKELGANAKEAHQAVGQKILEVKPDYTFLVGNEMKAAYELIKNRPNVFWFEKNTDDVFDLIVKTINHAVKKNDIVVLKGSNSMNLVKVYEKMLETVTVMQEAR